MPMASDKNMNYSLIYVLLAVIVICILSFAGDRIIKPAFDKLMGDQVLREFETAFQNVQHPSDTEPLSLRTAMGDFTDSEQGCDFYIGEVRGYDGSEQDILAFYADQSVKDHPIQVRFLDAGKFPTDLGFSLPEPLTDLSEWEIPSNAKQQPLYMVYLLVAGYEGDYQFNCR